MSSGPYTSSCVALMTSIADAPYGRWRLRVLWADRDTLFVGICTEANEEEAQVTADAASSVSTMPPPRFAPRCNNHEADLSTSDAVDTVDSDEEE